jgi:uncharacterized protein (TIGR02266 family)
MMRSTTTPRIQHDATVKFETGGDVVPPFDARAVNLSVGGLYVNAPTLLAPGVQVDLQVSLRDGQSPVHAKGEVVWVQDGADDERGMALRFLNLETGAEQRIERLVALRTREPTGTGTSSTRRELRIRLPSLPAPLRAVARDQTDRGLMLEAELPWLTLGSEIVAELSPDRAVEGTVRWVGLDVTRAGHARLRIFVEVRGEEPERPMEPAPAIHIDSVPHVTRTKPSRPPVVLTALAVGGAMALAAGATALLMRQPPPPAVLALPATEPVAPPEVHAPPVVAVPAATTPAPAPAPAATKAAAAADQKSADQKKHRRTARKHSVE